MSKLTPKQRRFIDFYLETWNATEAAKRAGYSAKTAYSQGGRLLKNVEVSKSVKERLRKTAMSTDEALLILGNIARGGMSDFMEFIDGVNQPLVRVTPENAHLVKEVTKGPLGELTFKLEDRQAAIDKILKAGGAYVNKLELSGKDGAELTINVKVRDDGDED